jgi:hypothetical protein
MFVRLCEKYLLTGLLILITLHLLHINSVTSSFRLYLIYGNILHTIINYAYGSLIISIK